MAGRPLGRPMAAEDGESGIRTTEIVFDIVESIERRQGARLVDITADVDRSKSTIYTHLVTLVRLGYVTNEDGVYQLGLKFLDLGTYARGVYEVYHAARPKLKRLAEETGERVQLMVESDGRGVYLARFEGSRAIPAAVRLGTPRYLHLSSAGKAILASLPDRRVDDIVAEWGLPTATDHTVVDPDALADELEAIRERGYALNRQESIQSAWSIGSPVRTGDEVLGAVSLSGPIHRLQDGSTVRDDLVTDVMAAVEEIEIDVSLAP